MRLLSTGLLLTGPIKKGIKGQVNGKESAIGMNWIKEMMELQDQSDDAKDFVETVKENYLAEKSMSLLQTEPFVLFQGFWTD